MTHPTRHSLIDHHGLNDTQEIIYSVMNEEQVATFETERECDMSFGIEGLSRFRLNLRKLKAKSYLKTNSP